MPPLSSTIARALPRLSLPFFVTLEVMYSDDVFRRTAALCPSPCSHAFQGRVPNELVNLQAKTSIDAVFKHPLCQLSRVEEALRAIAHTMGVLAESRREDYRGYLRGKPMPARKVTGKFVIRSIADDELHFVMRTQRGQVLIPE